MEPLLANGVFQNSWDYYAIVFKNCINIKNIKFENIEANLQSSILYLYYNN